ncbi:glycosyltransferase family 2 protein [Flavobacterium reichenbachii]|uniref:glycosyltransferase family 2 protein n=1 Tax=Flavobacterium reichenbachii TaxID=362418 RepID=UPI00068C56F8|nr:glycosyltransferase family 2 protein [Flavobacterium reichenbachii]OXB16110.1 glycosyl transferase [Flavobacterium reichenbachii]
MKNVEKPLVSIITVVFNNVRTLEQTINSVINQSYKNIEYIIIDGGSTDGSVDLIKKYESQISYWVSEPDKGIYYAMNKGLSVATGNLVSVLSSDDWYESTSVEKAVNYYELNPEIDIIHGLLRFIGANDMPDLVTGHYNSFLTKGMIEHPTCFITKKIYDKVGFYNVLYKSAGDYEWMLRAKKLEAKFLFIPELLTNFRRGGISGSYIGSLEELLIKKRFGVISNFKYRYWKIFYYLIFLKQKMSKS